MTKQLINGYFDYSLNLSHTDRVMFWLTGGRANTFGANEEPLRSSTGEPMYLYPYHTEALDHEMTHQFNLQNDDYGHVRFSVCDVSLIFTKQDHTLRPYIAGFIFDANGITEGSLGDFDIVLGTKPELAVVTYDPNFINSAEYLDTLCNEDQSHSRKLEHKIRDEFQQFANNCNNVYQKLIDEDYDITIDDFDKLNEEGIIRY